MLDTTGGGKSARPTYEPRIFQLKTPRPAAPKFRPKPHRYADTVSHRVLRRSQEAKSPFRLFANRRFWAHPAA
jgi:hypothetical protein